MSNTHLDEVIAATVRRSIEAQCFEDAADSVLHGMLTLARAALGAGQYDWDGSEGTLSSGVVGRLLRATLHVRPESGYQRIRGVEYPTLHPMEDAGHLTSGNVWRWLVEHRCSVSIDVQLGTIHPWLRCAVGTSAQGEPASSPSRQEGRPAEGGAPGEATRQRMLGRDATHVHVVPLRSATGAVVGLFAIEASCYAALGDPLLWADATVGLELLASAAAPYLAALPPRPSAPSPQAAPDPFLPVVGRSTAKLVELLRIFSRQEETLLVGGATGAGKSRIARFCHEASAHRGHPFETLDLLSVPEELQMAELFGWKRGAFTGAVKDSPGAITRASRGTLFIDEVDKLSLKAQAGLLRVLEERRFRPLGDDAGERRADVRFIVGTNADLRALVSAGRFREDLYYRINVLPVRLPALCDRLDELPEWANYMLQRRHGETGQASPVRLSPDALTLLTQMPWPGNLRQLDNIVRRAYALALTDPGMAPISLELRHVEQALAYEAPTEPDALFPLLWKAARAYVQDLERTDDAPRLLKLDVGDVLRGLVLGAAVSRWGRDEAFVRLGQRRLLKNRNHHRALRRELERVREFARSSASLPPAELTAVLNLADEVNGVGA